MRTGDWIVCLDCGKPVRLKRFLGLAHCCVTDKERGPEGSQQRKNFEAARQWRIISRMEQQ